MIHRCHHIQARSQPHKSNDSATESPTASASKDTTTSSTSSPAPKTPRTSTGSKSESSSSKSEKVTKTPTEKSGGDDKVRDLRHSISGDRGAKTQATRKRSDTLPNQLSVGYHILIVFAGHLVQALPTAG